MKNAGDKIGGLLALIILGTLLILIVASAARGVWLVPEDTDFAFPLKLVDATDGYTAETGKAFGDTTVQYAKDGGSWTAYTDDATTFIEVGNGHYWLKIGASEFTDPNEAIQIRVSVTGCRDASFMLYTTYQDPARLATTDDGGTINVASGVVEADAVQISGDSGAADNMENFWDETKVAAYMIEMFVTDHATNYDGTLNLFVCDANKVAGVAPMTQANIETYAETGANAALVDEGLDHLVREPVADEVADDSIIAKLVSKDATADWSDYAWTTESFEALRDGVLADILADTAAMDTAAEWLTLMADVLTEVEPNVTTILADTAAMDTAAEWDTLMATAIASIWSYSGGERSLTDFDEDDMNDIDLDSTTVNASASISSADKDDIVTRMDANSADLNTIIADTNELQTDWTDGGRLDTILDAVSAAETKALDTTIDAATDAKKFTLAAGDATDDFYQYTIISVQDADDSEWGFGVVKRYTGSTKEVLLFDPLPFTPANGDTVEITKGGYLKLAKPADN